MRQTQNLVLACNPTICKTLYSHLFSVHRACICGTPSLYTVHVCRHLFSVFFPTKKVLVSHAMISVCLLYFNMTVSLGSLRNQVPSEVCTSHACLLVCMYMYVRLLDILLVLMYILVHILFCLFELYFRRLSYTYQWCVHVYVT